MHSNSSMHRSDHLTPAQERVLRYIRQTIIDHGEAPTIREIGSALGMRSPATVHEQLGELAAKGAIIREPHRSRGIRLA
jgi:SOS-response transcriptional repressor LexA